MKDYFAVADRIDSAIRNDDFKSVVADIHEITALLHVMAGTLAGNRSNLGPDVAVLSDATKIVAVVGDRDLLDELRQIAATYPPFNQYLAEIERNIENAQIFDDIRQAVRENPNCKQADVKILINSVDGRRVANLIQYLERNGEISRTRQGRNILVEYVVK